MCEGTALGHLVEDKQIYISSIMAYKRQRCIEKLTLAKGPFRYVISMLGRGSVKPNTDFYWGVG